MPPVGFKPTISAGDRPQTYDLDRAATMMDYYVHKIRSNYWPNDGLLRSSEEILQWKKVIYKKYDVVLGCHLGYHVVGRLRNN